MDTKFLLTFVAVISIASIMAVAEFNIKIDVSQIRVLNAK